MNLKKCPINPVLYAWYQSWIVLFVLLIIRSSAPIPTQWIVWYAVAGVFMYIAYLMFMYLVLHLDVSVINAAWVFMAIIISAIGYIFFEEYFSYLQMVGAALAVISSCVLSFYHKHISVGKTLGMLLLAGSLYVPYYIIQKAAMLQGETSLAAFYYPLLTTCILSCISPLCRSNFRKLLFNNSTKLLPMFIVLLCANSAAGLLGTYYMTKAYQAGFASHVSITENTQPFMIIILASVISIVLPKYTPKELLTKQSIFLKIGCFTATFIGMALLAIG